MQNGQNINRSTHLPRPARSFADRSRRSNVPRSQPKGSHNAQGNYERYMALAQSEAQAGNRIAAENYYQYAEHFFRAMRSDKGAS